MLAHYRWSSAIFILCALVVSTEIVHAQFGLPGAESALSISFSPASPGPNDTVNVSVRSSLIDISEGDILWRANGKTIAQGRGVDSASIQAGALGSETSVDVTIALPDGTSVSTHAAILPTELDLLVDSDAYIPPFYAGRSLASAGSNLRLQALPRFIRGGVPLPASGLTYTWRRNGEVLGTLSGRGKSTVILPVMHLFGTDTISVEARSADGLLSHTTSFSFTATEPILMLYEDHPLYGVLYHRALGTSTFIPETEMTFAAVPLFMHAESVFDLGLNFAWRVNGAEIKTNQGEPNKLTINADNSSGIALIELGVTHATNYYFDAKGAWNITFSSSANSGSDLFHVPN